MAEPILWSIVETGPAVEKWMAGEGLEFLSLAEREILAGLRFERRRAEWLLGRWCAKILIRKGRFPDPDLPLASISILNEPGGAPYAIMDGSEAIPGCLSISHRSGVAACAWTNSPHAHIGIDIDLVEARDPSFLSDYFTETEQAFTRALPAQLRDRWVTMAWSAKESALKAMRTGLRIDTRRVQVGNPRGMFLGESRDGEWKTLSVRCADEPEGVWQSWWRKRGNFILTLACQGGEPPWVLEQV